MKDQYQQQKQQKGKTNDKRYNSMITNPRVINEYLDMLEQIDAAEQKFKDQLEDGHIMIKNFELPNLSLI